MSQLPFYNRYTIDNDIFILKNYEDLIGNFFRHRKKKKSSVPRTLVNHSDIAYKMKEKRHSVVFQVGLSWYEDGVFSESFRPLKGTLSQFRKFRVSS